MKILAQISNNSKILTVEIINIFTAGDGRKLATVKTIDGTHPFTDFSFNAGPMDSDTMRVRLDRIANLVMEYEPNPSVFIPAGAEVAL